MEIFQAQPDTSEAGELDFLLVSVKEYEDKHINLPKIME